MSAIRQVQPLAQSDTRKAEHQATIYQLPVRPEKACPKNTKPLAGNPEPLRTSAPDAKPTPLPQPPPAILYRADCALRPPDWRWLQAKVYGENYKTRRQKIWRTARQDGVGALLNFQRRAARCYDALTRGKLALAEPHLYQAYTIAQLAPDAPVRLMIECLVLADTPVPAIAAEVGMPIETIGEFERVFYDTRTRLGSRSLAIHLIAGGRLLTETYQITRFLSYLGGEWIAKRLVQGTLSEIAAASSDEATGFLHQTMLETLQVKATIAAHLLNIDDPKIAARALKTWLSLENSQVGRNNARTEHANLQELRPRHKLASAATGDFLKVLKAAIGTAKQVKKRHRAQASKKGKVQENHSK